MKATMNIDDIWESLEEQHGNNPQRLQRLVGNTLLSRVYVGLEGIPSKRLIVIEVPERYKDAFAKFVDPLGIAIDVEKTGGEKQGFISCILHVLSSDLNDIFSIVVQDVVSYLDTVKNVEKYVQALQERIDKWKVFFQTKKLHALSPQMIVGLYGELNFILMLKKAGYVNAVSLWNGPLKAAQDFQTTYFAAEIKTVVGNNANSVHISSVEQLEIGARQYLFLVVTRIEYDDAHGITLPELISKVKDNLEESEANKLMAKLVCLGYEETEKDRYVKRYSIKETFFYDVIGDFPKIKRKDISSSIFNLNYSLNLLDCIQFKTKFHNVVQALGVDNNE